MRGAGWGRGGVIKNLKDGRRVQCGSLPLHPCHNSWPIRGTIAGVLFMAGGVESILADKASDWLCGLLEGFAAEVTGRIGD